ncbi:MAG: hypothetical protein ACYC8T_26605 [Myxococcaceae bacterium]
MAARQLVTLPGQWVDLGLDAAGVVQVALSSEWMDVAPLDLAACLGWEPALEESLGGRVLVVHSHRGDVPLQAAGRVGLCDAEASGVLPLPPEVLRGHCATALGAIFIEEGRRSVLLLEPEGLWHLFELNAGAGGFA